MQLSLIIILVVFAAILLLILLKLYGQKSGGGTDSAMLVQQQIDSLRGEVSQNLKNTADSVNEALKSTTNVLFQSLKNTSETVNQQLNVVTSQLSNVTQQLQTNTGQMGTRLDNAAGVIKEVATKLGELGKATQEIKELGQSVSKLEEMLKAPKLRGGLGELLLEDLLKQVLPSNAYAFQHSFKNGQTVDAVIKTAGGMVPVDSKFPLENFRKTIEAKSDQERKTAARLFKTDVKKHVDAIAQKYILPDEGTFDFALMYVPAENIYYETIIKEDSFEEETSIYSYASAKHVVPVSPNTFYAHLRVIALGLKGLLIERSAKEIYQHLHRLESELAKFTELFGTLGTQLANAKNNYDKADKQLSTFSDKLKSVQSIPESEPPKQLDVF
ncbi:MAG TPA: DNA recombination protein RmuC [Bacteroidota bacterium]